MKKILCILLMLILTLPALAEPGYMLHAPEGAETESTESSVTYVAETARVVAIMIGRVPDEDPETAVLRMLSQFDPNAVIGDDLPMAEGFTAVQAVTEDKFGEGVDQLTIMVLSSTGDLLILSAYDLTGNEVKAQTLLDQVLMNVKVHDKSIFAKE